jgi:hypothetical protein
MKTFKDLFPENLYHSYIVEGEPEKTSLALLSFLEKKGEISAHSPDLWIQTYDSFTIIDSHKVKEWHSQMKVGLGKKVCIIGANFINNEAEKTLLKMIEEPAADTHFFIVVPNSLSLVDTIRSRVHVVKSLFLKTDNKNIKQKAEEFLSANFKKRIDIITQIIKENKEKEENNSHLRFWAISFISEIEKIIFVKFKEDKKNKEIINLLEEIKKDREFLNLPGSSVKMILEHLALVI